MNLTLIASLISAAAAGLAGFGLAWRLQTATINDMKLEQANERISLQRAARAAIERQQSAVSLAQAAAVQRRRDLDAVRRDSDTAIDGLRNATAAAVRAASASLDACLIGANALSVVSTQCSAELTTLAGHCDGHVSDLKLITESWPN